MGEHVGQPDHRALAVGIVGVVALDGRSDGLGQPPAAGEHAAHERVVHAQLTALPVHPLLGRASSLMHLRRVARVCVHEHELSDVVQQRRDSEAVAVLITDFARHAVRGMLGRQRVQPEALGSSFPYA